MWSWPVNMLMSQIMNTKNIWISFQTNPAGLKSVKVLLNGNIITAQGGYFALETWQSSIRNEFESIYQTKREDVSPDSIVATVGWACNSTLQIWTILLVHLWNSTLCKGHLHTNMDVSSTTACHREQSCGNLWFMPKTLSSWFRWITSAKSEASISYWTHMFHREWS